MALVRYEVLKEIGRGTFAIIFLARDKQTNELVAVKEIKKNKVRPENYENEIMVFDKLRRFPHPNIIQLKEIIETQELLYIITEYAPKGDLLAVMSSCKAPIAETVVRGIFAKVLLAVEHLHSLGLIHRDIKLENILLTEGLEPKLADFNLSCVYSPTEKINSFCGSLMYSPPEMIFKTPYTGPEVDVWCLGVLLYALLFLQFPFPMRDGETKIQLARKIVSGKFVFPSGITVSSQVRELISWMLSVEQLERPSLYNVRIHPWVERDRPKKGKLSASQETSEWNFTHQAEVVSYEGEDDFFNKNHENEKFSKKKGASSFLSGALPRSKHIVKDLCWRIKNVL